MGGAVGRAKELNPSTTPSPELPASSTSEVVVTPEVVEEARVKQSVWETRTANPSRRTATLSFSPWKVSGGDQRKTPEQLLEMYGGATCDEWSRLSDEEKGKRLWDAAAKGDMADVTAALDLGAPASWPNPEVSAESASLRAIRTIDLYKPNSNSNPNPDPNPEPHPRPRSPLTVAPTQSSP